MKTFPLSSWSCECPDDGRGAERVALLEEPLQRGATPFEPITLTEEFGNALEGASTVCSNPCGCCPGDFDVDKGYPGEDED